MDLVRVDGMNEYSVLGKIGEGSYSKVFKVQRTHSSDFYAMKVLNIRFRTIDEVYKCQEVLAMARLASHPNILGLRDVIFEPLKRRLSLVVELADCSMLDVIDPKSKQPNLTLNDCLYLTYQLLSALSHVHSQGYIHRDVKPENCLINSKTMELKLADFGSATEPSNGNTPLTEYIATRWYRAPECLLTPGNYGVEIDIWAVGCVFYELITKKPLFPGANAVDQLKCIHSVIGEPSPETLSRMHTSKTKLNEFSKSSQKSQYFTFNNPKSNPLGFKKLLPNVPSDVIDLLEKLLTYVPNDRITAADALNHRAFNSLNNRINRNAQHPIPNTPKLAPLIKRPINTNNINRIMENKLANRTRTVLEHGRSIIAPKLPQSKLYLPKGHLPGNPQFQIQNQTRINGTLQINPKKKSQSVLCQVGSCLPGIYASHH